VPAEAVASSTATRNAATISLPILAAPSTFAALAPPVDFAQLLPIWQQAGSTYGVPWQILAAINKVETNDGQNLGPSSAGAVGWMQFMPATWARWGTDANGDGIANPSNPVDAINSAARYLVAAGAQQDLPSAIYAYNHAWWYVDEVLGIARSYGYAG